jgi:hypothetical protein
VPGSGGERLDGARHLSCKMLNSEEVLAIESVIHRAGPSGERYVQRARWEGQPRRSKQALQGTPIHPTGPGGF